MKEKLTVYFKDMLSSPLIIHFVDSVDIDNNAKILRVTNNGVFCYVIPLENIIYSVTEAEDFE